MIFTFRAPGPAILRILSFVSQMPGDKRSYLPKMHQSDKIGFDLFYNFAYQTLCAAGPQKQPPEHVYTPYGGL